MKTILSLAAVVALFAGFGALDARADGFRGSGHESRYARRDSYRSRSECGPQQAERRRRDDHSRRSTFRTRDCRPPVQYHRPVVRSWSRNSCR